MNQNEEQLQDFEVTTSTKTSEDRASPDFNMSESRSTSIEADNPKANLKIVVDSWARLAESTLELIASETKPTKPKKIRTSWRSSLDSPGFPCRQCHYVAKKKGHLKSHYFYRHMTLLEKRKVALHKCNQCIYSSTHPGELKNHLIKVHPKPEIFNQTKAGTSTVKSNAQTSTIKAENLTEILICPQNSNFKSKVQTQTFKEDGQTSIKESQLTSELEAQSTTQVLTQNFAQKHPPASLVRPQDAQPETLAGAKHLVLDQLYQNSKLKRKASAKIKPEKSKVKPLASDLRVGSQTLEFDPPTPDEQNEPQLGSGSVTSISCRDCDNFQVDNLIDLYLHMEEKHGKFLALIDLATLATKFKIDV